MDNTVIILVGTKHPGNLGSVARAMQNMELSELRLAAPQCAITEESHRMARKGGVILDRARIFRSLDSASRGIHLLIGTSGKTGGKRSQVWAPRALAPRLVEHASRQKLGIVFGPEDTGLVDDDLLLCQMLIRIPTSPQARSLNLAQAVMIVAYELFLARPRPREPLQALKRASSAQSEAMFDQLEEALLEIGFLHPQNARHMMFGLRRLLGRAGLEARDVGILRGIARQIKWYAGARGIRVQPSDRM